MRQTKGESYLVDLSVFEIYNNEIQDLLNPFQVALFFLFNVL